MLYYPCTYSHTCFLLGDTVTVVSATLDIIFHTLANYYSMLGDTVTGYYLATLDTR